MGSHAKLPQNPVLQLVGEAQERVPAVAAASAGASSSHSRSVPGVPAATSRRTIVPSIGKPSSAIRVRVWNAFSRFTSRAA